MFNIGNFFDKFKNVALKEFVVREKIVNAIKEHTGATIDLKDIEFLNKIIRIKGSPSLKSQIFIKKTAILDTLRGSMPGMIITDVQ
ncbi:MAG: hypothetical protein RIS29_226 [Bacteroidota bacterium]|jgi:hypothetical protein